MFGLIVFIADALVDQRPIPQIFCIFMLVVGLIYFLFLYIDIRMHIGKARKAVNERDEQMRRYEDQIHHIEVNELVSFTSNKTITAFLYILHKGTFSIIIRNETNGKWKCCANSNT